MRWFALRSSFCAMRTCSLRGSGIAEPRYDTSKQRFRRVWVDGQIIDPTKARRSACRFLVLVVGWATFAFYWEPCSALHAPLSAERDAGAPTSQTPGGSAETLISPGVCRNSSKNDEFDRPTILFRYTNMDFYQINYSPFYY